MANLGCKRKRVVVSMEKRLSAIQRMDKGESLKAIAFDLGVGESTVGDWKKRRSEIEAFCSRVESKKALQNRLILKKPKLENLDGALLLWFNQEREKGMPISGPILKEMALILHQIIGGDETFVASEGWLNRWKKRHAVNHLAISAEKVPADTKGVKCFQETLQEMIYKENLTAEQLYSVDETGLYYRMLPSKSLSSIKEADVPGYKISKDRVTLSLCSNSTGTHKLPLMFIGKSKKPRSFKNINMASLPVHYRAHNSAWMNTFLFTEWFQSQFVPAVAKHLESKKLPLKAILLLDNAPSHPNEGELKVGNIKAVFIPQNIASLVQPMDQGVIKSLKRRYRMKLLTALLENDDANVSLIDLIKAMSIKEVVYMAASAWLEIPTSTLEKSWWNLIPPKHLEIRGQKLFKVTEEMPSELSASSFVRMFKELQGCSDIREEDVELWMSLDNELGLELLSDYDIIGAVTDAPQDEGEDSDNVDSLGDSRVSHSDAVKTLDMALHYVEQQSTSTPMDVMLLKKWRDFAAKSSLLCLKQK